MEVEDYSAKSECYGAFERRRETSTMEEFKGAMNKRMDEMEERMSDKFQMMTAAIKAILAERQGRGASCERMDRFEQTRNGVEGGDRDAGQAFEGT